MKLIVQIPCYNEAESLPRTLNEIPRSVSGIDSVEVLVVDDGSTDGSSDVARRCGADFVVRHARNRGLAKAFRTGVDASLRLGADIIVNTDADGQYAGADIPMLVRPILEGRADLVVGDRRVATLRHVSRTRRLLHRFGSALVRRVSRVEVADAVSGFRALSRAAALRINVLSNFSYTIETLVQAGHDRLAVVEVPVVARETTRSSRLFRSAPEFLAHSATTLLRTYTMYRPLRIFTVFGLTLILIGALPVGRFLYFFWYGQGSGHVQSLVLGGVALVLGFVALLVGLVADLIAFNRKLLELLLEKVRRFESGAAGGPLSRDPPT